MAVLTTAERTALRAALAKELSNERDPLGLLVKADLQAALDATDTWVEDNQASFNAAIPEPAKTELTAQQKARLFMFVVRRRFELG